MLMPNGQSATKIEKVMLLNLWAHSLNQQTASSKKGVIFAGIGKPTYPANPTMIQSHLAYWQRIQNITEQWHLDPSSVIESAAIDYGDPRGDLKAKTMMAEAMSSWYESAVKPEELLFTVGGLSALHLLFESFNALYGKTSRYRVITPFPHYPAYANNRRHSLHPVEVMNSPGYNVTAEALEKSIKSAYALAKSDNTLPRAVLFCNPSNPLGTTIEKAEFEKIAEVLRLYPDLHIIFDEAYIEMSLIKLPSFLKIAPDLKERVIILRSATKALSAAGERIAAIMIFDPYLMNEMLNQHVNCFVHAPRSAQQAYAEAMASYNMATQREIAHFYLDKVAYVEKRLKAMGAAMPDPNYQVKATFYILADFSGLFGRDIPYEATIPLQKSGKITTDEDIAYFLLFKERVMLAPLSYSGLPKDCGYMRITCSGHAKELCEMMDRLERVYTAKWIPRLRGG